MFHLEVLAGKHHDKAAKGRKSVACYQKGDILKSHVDLRKTFPNKFRLVKEDAVASPADEPTLKLISDRGKYSVVNTATGKALNERPLTKTEADKLMNSQEETD